MTTIYLVYLGIAFVIVLSPIAFYRFTRVENPVEYSDSASFLGRTGFIFFLLCLPIYFAICALTSSYFYLQSYPEEPIFGKTGAEWGGFLQGDAPGYYGIAATLGMLIFASGSIWALFNASRRWEAKVWEDPGTMSSKAIRAISYFMNVYFAPIVLAVGIGLLWYFFGEQFQTNLATIPYWFRQAINQDLNENEQSYVIGFAVIAGIALLVGLWALICLLRALLSSFWTKNEATISRSELYTYVSGAGRSRSVNHRFLVDYDYVVDGIGYSGNSLSYSTQWIYHNKPYIWWQTKRYPVGAQVEVFVNPNKPQEAVLQAGIDWWGTLVIALHVGLFFIAATIFLIPEIIR